MKNCFKNIKRLKQKIVSMILLVAILTLDFSPFAVKATAQQLQFYSPGVISVGYDSANGKNVWYSRATLGGDVSYCIDYTCPAPSGTMTFRSYLSDQGMAILMNGYPNCSPEAIGCSSADEAYMATQMALWEVMNRTGESQKSGLIFRVENVTPKAGKEDFYNRSVAAAKRLVAMAEANPYTAVPTLVINTTAAQLHDFNGDALIGPYTVTIEGTQSAVIKSITASLVNAPASARITDANGNEKTALSSGDSVYVRMSKSEESKKFNVKFSADIDRKVGAIYTKAGQTVQDYVKIETEPNTAEREVTIDWEKTTTLGKIKLTKVDQDDQPVSGATFELKDTTGKSYGQVTTGDDGIITFYKVPEGQYILEEIEAPQGYTITEKSKNVTVVGGQTVEVKFVNDRITGRLVITKVDDTNKPLANVTFEIQDSNNKVVGRITTNEEGKASINLDYGTYYFKEISAPAGYIMDTKTYTLNVNAENRTFYKTVTNERCKGNLLIVKTDEDKAPIQGVKFNILDADKNVILTIITNEKGLAGAKNLPMGTYYYQEIEAPEDVVIDNGVYEFKIDTQDQVVRKDIVNEKISGKLKITKVNEDNEVIQGVKFEILNEKKEVVDTIITDEQGIATSKELVKGKYYYREVEVPSQYILDSTEHEFYIENKGQVISKNVVNYMAKGLLKIVKKDSNGQALANVKFNILDENKNVVDTIITGKDGIAKSKNLPLGKYYYQEVEVPDNIVLDDTIHTFTLTENNQVITKNIVNDYITGRLSIIKVDENKKPLANVKFNILDENKNVVDTIVTDSLGNAVSKKLVKGTYYYQEIEAPKGIVVDDNIYEFKIETNNQNVVKNIVNVYAKGTIVITKYDSTGALLSNVKFQILNEAGDVVDTITTNEQGVATSKKLLLGKYFYREISAPDHVVMDTEKHEFSLTENNEIVKKDVINKVKEGKLKIIKVDENNKPLEGVTFNIYDEDRTLVDTIVTNKDGIAQSKDLVKGKYYYQEVSAPEGIVVDDTMYEFEIVEDGQNVIKNMINYYAKGTLQITKYDSNNKTLANVKFEITDKEGNVVDTIVTNEQGKAESKRLPNGTYYYQEVEAPDNVIIDTNKYEFSLSQDNQVVQKTIVNKIKEGKLKIIKVDENNEPLEGVTFNIYNEDKTLVDTIVTNKDGIAQSKELEKGKYYYQEVSAPEGIVVDNTMYEFEIVEDGQNVIKNMINYYAKGTLQITKYDSNNKTLANVKFEITDKEGNVVDTIVTNEQGKAESKKLPIGTYYYQEIEAPDNVVIDTNKYEFALTENNQVIQKTIVNKIKEGKLKIIKVDENNEPLEGVTFNIYDEYKTLVDTIVTNKDGIAQSKELEKGKYYYQEVSAPEGIVVDNTMYEFEIVEDGQNVIKNMINYYIKGELKIYKLSEGDNKPLANAKFNIYDEQRNIVDTIVTDGNGVAVSKKLMYGTYYYQEIEAPDGYILDNAEYKFNIDQEKEQIAVVYNKKQELPKTGGSISSDMQIILLVSAFSILGYALVNVLKKKEQY